MCLDLTESLSVWSQAWLTFTLLQQIKWGPRQLVGSWFLTPSQHYGSHQVKGDQDNSLSYSRRLPISPHVIQAVPNRNCEFLSSSVQDGTYALRKAHMRSTPILSEVFSNVAFETVPMFVWLTMALSRPFKDRLALPLSTPLSSRRGVLFCFWLCPRM